MGPGRSLDAEFELVAGLRRLELHDPDRFPPTGPDGDALQIVGLDSAIIQNPKTWIASGHVAGFNDPMIDCRACKARLRTRGSILHGGGCH